MQENNRQLTGQGRTPTALLLLVVLLATLLAACANVVHPPASPAEPRTVFVLDHGRHTSLAITTADGRLIRYAYGEWRWYAEEETGLLRAFGAVLTPTAAALGRRELPGPPTYGNVRKRMAGSRAVLEIHVPAADVDALHDELENLFYARSKDMLWNPRYNLMFVPHPQRYSMFHHSSHAVADWLERLQCEVRLGWPTSPWRMGEPLKR